MFKCIQSKDREILSMIIKLSKALPVLPPR